MNREVIQDFLNLTGVVGISLTNRRMRPYFYGFDAVLDRTKQALGQGVLQVVENIPEGFESFDFHFAGHVVYIYKLTHGLVLLVLTNSSRLKLVDYKRTITKIKYLIETDTYNTVAHFKLLLGSVTQSSLPSQNWNLHSIEASTQVTAQNQQDTTSFADKVAKPNIEKISNISASTKANISENKITETYETTELKDIRTQAIVTNSQTPPKSASPVSVVKLTTEPISINKPAQVTDSIKSVSVKTGTQEYKLDELLSALNKLSLFTTQYLGKVVVVNYWKSSRPDSSWISEFEVDRNGQISNPKQSAIILSSDQHYQIQAWVKSYIDRCKKVIRNFDHMLEQDCLDDHQRKILL